MNPLVSIIIPVYNGERFIEETLGSVHNQTYSGLECIIVDDGSKDKTMSLIASFLYDKRFSYVYQDNAGAASALNAGIRLSSGKYIAWLSADDVFMPDKIEMQVEMMEMMRERKVICDMTYSDFEIINEEGIHIENVRVNPPSDGNMFRQVLLQNIINGSSVVMRRDVFDIIGYFREDIPVDVDGDMWLRMLGNEMCIEHIPQVLLKYRKHSGQLSHDRARMTTVKDQVRSEALRAFPRDDLDYSYIRDQLELRGLRTAARVARVHAFWKRQEELETRR